MASPITGTEAERLHMLSTGRQRTRRWRAGLEKEQYIAKVHRAQRPAPLGHQRRAEEHPHSQNCFLPGLVVTHRKLERH